MSIEYKLKYTGAEIDEKLEQVGTNKANITQLNEDIGNIGGTVEVTSGEPTKENTVVTISPSSETTNIYTAEEVDAKFEQMSEEIIDLQSEVVIEAIEEKVNIYNPNLQTEETISPHYYVDGYPYSDTSFDNAYNATALIEIEPDTTYAIVLIPDVNGYATPWAGASNSLFFYDKDEVYVGKHKDKNSHVFTTPFNAKYIRFNYALARSITLEKLNARCVIVKGDSIPTEYIPYKETEIKKTKLKDEVIALRADVDNINNVLNEKNYIEPLRIYYKANCYPVEATGKLFVTSASHTDVVAYRLEMGKTYFFKADAPSDVSTITYVVTQEALYDMPESGYNTGVNYIYVNKESVTGRFEYELKPSENCYIYIQITNEEKIQNNEYLNPYKNVYTQGFFAKFEAQINNLKKIAYSIENENEIMISQKYSNDIDIQFLLKRKGGNELFDFYKIYKIANADNVPKVHDVTSVTPFLSAVGDWHAPFQIKAVNNADGTQIDKKYFTGGNHQYNNSGSGSTATARSVSVDFIIDGIKMTSGNGYANEIVMKWSNNVQGYNTTKEDGTGREILQERHTMTLKDGIFHTSVELVPLEDVICDLWYGFQMFTTPYDTVQYIDGLNRTQFDFSSESNCGDKEASRVRFVNSDEDICEIKVNTAYDLGKRNNVTGVKGIFSTNYGKAYFTIINDSLSMVSGGVYSLEGEYIFRHGNF